MKKQDGHDVISPQNSVCWCRQPAWSRLARFAGLYIPSEARLSAVVPHFDGSITSLEEKYSDLPRYNTVGELIAHEQFDAAIVAVNNRNSVSVIEELAAAGETPSGRKARVAGHGGWNVSRMLWTLPGWHFKQVTCGGMMIAQAV